MTARSMGSKGIRRQAAHASLTTTSGASNPVILACCPTRNGELRIVATHDQRRPGESAIHGTRPATKSDWTNRTGRPGQPSAHRASTDPHGSTAMGVSSSVTSEHRTTLRRAPNDDRPAPGTGAIGAPPSRVMNSTRLCKRPRSSRPPIEFEGASASRRSCDVPQSRVGGGT
jgi:hypothetical protein